MPEPAAHPYLFFSDRDLPALRRRIKSGPLAARAPVLFRNADRFCKQRAYGMRHVRQALGLCATTAFAYAVSQRKKFGRRALAEAHSLLERPAWHRELGYNHGANLESAEASMACAFVYDLCRDLLNDAEARDFRARLLTLSTQVYLRSVEEFRDWWVDNPVTNWCGVCHGGHGLAALAMYHEEPLARRAAAYARKHLRVFLRNVVGADGGGHEGVMYWLYGMSFGHRFWHAATRLFGDDGGLYADLTRKRAGYWLAHMLAPDGAYANFNNMDERTCAGYPGREMERAPEGTLCALFERHAPGGDRMLRWAADHGGTSYYYHFADPLWFVWRSPRPVQKQRPALPDAVHFRTAGHAVLKSKDLWIAFNGGWSSNACHANRDLGSFVLVWKGTRLIHDPGYGKSATAQHSTLLAGKQEQILGAGGRILRFGSGRGFHYLACELAAVYPGWLKRFVRHLVLVDGRYAVLLDDVEQLGPSRRELELRFQTRGEIEAVPAERRAVLTHEDAALHVVAAAPGDAVLQADRDVLAFLRVNPFVRRFNETFATVLYPGDPKSAAPAADFAEAGARGTLCVTRPDGVRDELVFRRVRGAWALASFNGASAAKIPPGSRQSVFRLGQ
ncbi:MAG: heparinase II/III family protein [Planctomycetota bacterium]|nr:heparinase II/III family protein [Planctomycetota bacterium]